MQKRAPFVVIEGLDRSGKTTQIALLHSRLESMGIRTQLVKFPDRTTAIGKMIDSYLRSQSELDDHAIHLLFSANRWELASTITNLLTSGTLVLCDRYAFSGITFSAAKPSLRDTFPSTHGDALPWCRAPDISLPAPDLTIFLDITPEQAKIRDGYGEERYEKEETQKRVREMFHRLGAEMTSSQDDVNSNRDNRWIVVDAKDLMEILPDYGRINSASDYLVLPCSEDATLTDEEQWMNYAQAQSVWQLSSMKSWTWFNKNRTNTGNNATSSSLPIRAYAFLPYQSIFNEDVN